MGLAKEEELSNNEGYKATAPRGHYSIIVGLLQLRWSPFYLFFSFRVLFSFPASTLQPLFVLLLPKVPSSTKVPYSPKILLYAQYDSCRRSVTTTTN
jgi:hypothetical protein